MRYLFLILAIIAFSCKNKIDKPQIQDSQLSSENKILDGLYVCEYSNSDFKGIRIYSDNTSYSIYQSLGGRYSDPNLNLGYETPMKFYLKDNFLYTFHLDEDFERILKDGTLVENKKPTYRIVSVDTFNDGYSVTQEVLLQDYYDENREILLTKSINDTIEREIKLRPGQKTLEEIFFGKK